MRAGVMVLATVLALTGCAGAPKRYETDTRKSLALNVLEAAGINPSNKIKDMEETELRQRVQSWGALNDTVLTLNSFAKGAVLFGIGTLLLPTDEDPLTQVHLLTWMPAREAATEEEAQKRYLELLDRAIKQMAAEQSRAPYELEVKDYGPDVWYNLIGNDCHADLVSKRANPCVIASTNPDIKPYKVACPSFIGTEECWRWWEGGRYRAVAFRPSFRAYYKKQGLLRRKFYAQEPSAFDAFLSLSRHLPPWVYVYLPPTGKVSLGESNGFLHYPVVLNQGKVLYFVKPFRS